MSVKSFCLTRVLLCAILLVASILLVAPAAFADDPELPPNCVMGAHSGSAAVYLICLPPSAAWNGDLVLFAHGYVSPTEPVGIPVDQLVLPDGTSIPGLINTLGYAFATTSYSANGLAVKEGLADLQELVTIFEGAVAPARYVYLIGASEGGLITALGVERYWNVFDGGVATCGPVGSFRGQINYWGDARVLFDYFFPQIQIPNSAVDIDPQVLTDWETVYVPAITAALIADPDATRQLIATAKIAVDPQNPQASAVEAILQVLWYNVFATNDGVAKLGGQPFDNARRWYVGSDNDRRLNRRVDRYRADPAALAEIAATYETSGNLTVPIVTAHTLGDPVVPYWHEPLYRAKVWHNRDYRLHTNIPSLQYGHCNFTLLESLAAFAVLVRQVSGEGLLDVGAVLPEASAQAEFEGLVGEHIQ